MSASNAATPDGGGEYGIPENPARSASVLPRRSAACALIDPRPRLGLDLADPPWCDFLFFFFVCDFGADFTALALAFLGLALAFFWAFFFG